MDLQFSGLLTAALKLFREKTAPLEDLCFSLQETALSMVVEVVERALAQTGKGEVLLTGGFARNQRIRDMIGEMVKLHNATFHVVPPEYATDNGVMIAWTGILMHRSGLRLSVEDSLVKPKWRIEDVQIFWMMKNS
jgi:N6-L-threonylcarbamoyladenine synthase